MDGGDPSLHAPGTWVSAPQVPVYTERTALRGLLVFRKHWPHVLRYTEPLHGNVNEYQTSGEASEEPQGAGESEPGTEGVAHVVVPQMADET